MWKETLRLLWVIQAGCLTAVRLRDSEGPLYSSSAFEAR